jgi:hypothetical protein
MEICGQYFSMEMISRIQMTVNKDPTISRRAFEIISWINVTQVVTLDKSFLTKRISLWQNSKVSKKYDIDLIPLSDK